MSQDHELGVMPDPAAVRAACERLALELRLQREDTLIPDAGQARFMLDIHLLIRALSARDEAGEACRNLDAVLADMKASPLAQMGDAELTFEWAGDGWLVYWAGDRVAKDADWRAAIQALAAQVAVGKQESAAGEAEMKEAGEG